MAVNLSIVTTVNGPVYSAGGFITITSDGAIDGGPTGVIAQAFDITTLTNSGSILGGTIAQGMTVGGAGVANNQTITTLINNGAIDGGGGGMDGLTIGLGGVGVLNRGVISTLINTGGTIAGGAGGYGEASAASGGSGVFNANGATITTLINSGTIVGGDGSQSVEVMGIEGAGGSGVYNAGVIGDVFNTGTIESGGGGGFGLVVTDGVHNASGATMTTLTNSGMIEGNVEGVDNEGTITDLFNSGVMEGGSQEFAGYGATAGVFNAAEITTLTNSGTIEGSSVGVFNTGAITNLFNTGTINNASQELNGFNGTSGALLNTTGATIATLTNSGTIEGSRLGVFNEGAIANLFNTGTIKAETGPGEYALYSSGSLLSAKNNGAIDGEVYISASGDSFINQAKGVIDGAFKYAQYDSLANDGKIVGDVSLGAHDWLGNRGVIQGEVTLGTADVYNDIAGSAVGELNGASQDVFQFSGKYGDVTIKNFVAGSAASHATLQFANDFASMTALQHATTQVSGDVVIRLDSTDAITLVNLKLSALSSVDFKLV